MDQLDPGDRASGEGATIPNIDSANMPCSLEEWRLLGEPEGMDLRVDAEEELDDAYAALARARRIVLVFPVFMDGRGFSHARSLRAAGFTGELIAGGDVLPDQWVYLERCGFTGLEQSDVAHTAAELPGFANAYQADAREAEPLFRRRWD